MSAAWYPERDLDRLLDALTAELLATREGEILLGVRLGGEDPEAVAQEVRRLVSVADSGVTTSVLSPPLAHGIRDGARHQ
jgi:hypothetical protein